MKTLKNILYCGAAALLTLGSAACSDSFLDVESKTEPNSGNYYKNQSQAYRALIGCYDGWRLTSSCVDDYPFLIASNIMSDECYGGAGTGDGRQAQVIDGFDPSISLSDVNIFQKAWQYYYAAVYRCNELITKEEQIEWGENDNRSLYIGEARALRAIMYFDMVRLWGNIPLLLEPSQENVPQAQPSAVYAAIFDDLRYAIDNIPAAANADAESIGRITRYAAEGIFARAYLFYSGYYGQDPAYSSGTVITRTEALAAAEDVVTSQRYGLVGEFKNLWPAASLVQISGKPGWDTELSTYAGDANSEVILAQLFTPTQDYDGNNDANRWLVNLGMRGLDYGIYYHGWGIATVTTSYFRKFFDNRDLRRTASVIDLSAEGVANAADYDAAVKDWREYTGLTIKKYCGLRFGDGMPATSPDGTADWMMNNTQPYVVLRLADVMLMAAELGSPNAQSYLDNIRSRAGLPSVAPTKQNILDERARELAYEGVRYWDLLRQGVEVMADAVVASAGTVQTGGLNATVTYKRDQIMRTRGLCQIPQNQITLSNGVLKQNPGWE